MRTREVCAQVTGMITRNERRWCLIFAAVVMLLTTLPYILGYANQNASWRYSGLLFASEDGNSYIAKMLEGASGAWLFRTPYTAYPQTGMLAFLPYLLLGKLTAPPGQHDQLVALFHLFRIAGGLLMILATYDFLALFIQDVRYRRAGLAIAVLGGGLGWLFLLGLSRLWAGGIPGLEIPLEFYSPEAFGFLSILGLPHLAFARAFLLWGLFQYLRPTGIRPGRWAGLKGGLLWLALGLMQPLTIVIGWAVVLAHLAGSGAWQYLRARTASADWATWRIFFWRAVGMVLISAPWVVYNFLVFKLDPLLSRWQAQNLIPSPPVTHYLLAYGLFLIPALLGAWMLVRQNPWQGALPVAWLAIFLPLAYAPYELQRRLIEGVWVVFSLLVIFWLSCQKARLKRYLTPALALSLLPTLFLFAGGLLSVLKPSPPLYLPADEVKAFQYLADHVTGSPAVLAAYESSNPLPAWAPVRTLVGHGPESVNLSQIQPKVACFYSPSCSDNQRKSLLNEFDVRYVIWGPQERALGGWDPASAPYLKEADRQGAYTIFEVADGHASR